MSLSNCVSIVNRLDPRDQEIILVALDRHLEAGMDPKVAQRRAVQEAIDGLGVMLSERDQTDTPQFKRWSNDAPLVTSAAAATYAFKSGDKVALEAFHGTGRGDRVGNVFKRSRATSGPMAYFTSSPDLASGYATGKADTSLSMEDSPYETWFKYKPKGQRTATDISRAWSSLDPETQARVAQRMPDIRLDDDNEVIYEEGGGDIGSYGWNLKQTQKSYDRRGNPLAAAVETWLTSGSLFDEEQSFMKVLQLAGMPMADIEFNNPGETFPFVYKTYVKMGHPLVTSDVPSKVEDALRAAAQTDRSRAKSYGADTWDKNTITLKQWVDGYLNPARGDNTYSWTSIPDKVTEVFKSLGYDGIIDWSGKAGGFAHPVYIPFMENQVKSALGNNGKFDDSKTNILLSERVTDAWTSYASEDDAFAFGNTEGMRSKSLYAVTKAFSTPDLKLNVSSIPQFEDNYQIEVNGDQVNGSMALMRVGEGRYKVNATGATPASGKTVDNQGQRMYQALFAFAHNNGWKVDADFTLSHVNELRRTSAMLSSVLRFGTAKHLGLVDEMQGIEDWTPADFAGSVKALATAEMRKVAQRVQRFNNFEINPATGVVSYLSVPTEALVLDDGQDRPGAPVGDGSEAYESGGGSAKAVRSDAIQGDRTRNAAGQERAGSAVGGAQADVYNPTRVGVPVGNRVRVSGSAVTDSQLKDYLARTGGGFGSHGVGVVTLKRALITRAFAERGELGEVGLGGLLYSIRAGTSAWDEPTPSRFDDFIYKAQDKMIDVKRVVESISKSVGKVADGINVYLQEELFHGRAAKRTQDFAQQELQPLMQSMADAGLTIGDVEEYLHARHAQEANTLIAGRESSMPDGGSGMTNAAAAAYLANIPTEQQQKLVDAARQVDAILAKTRQMYADYGLESQQTVDGWAQMFQHYVPLQREDKEGSMGIGQGFSVKGKEVKGRTGSTRKVVDILANVAMQRERLVVRGEKNRVSQALLGLATANPNPDFWTVGSPPKERVYDPKTNTVVERTDPMYKSRDNVLVAKVRQANGEVVEMAVNFNEDDPRALRMAQSLKNMDAGNLEGLLGVSAKITRYFAAINTQYNPVFGVVNLIRDVQGAMVNLAGTPLAGQQAKIAKDAVLAIGGIYSDIRAERRGGSASSSWATWFEDFQKEGGQTGFRDLFKTSADRADQLQSILTPGGWMNSGWGKIFTAGGTLKVPMAQAQKGAGFIFGWLSDYNDAMENGVRLASYKAAVESGMSKQQAASLAKNLTVNFNRKGQVGQQAGAVYAFFNAAMQGSARLGQTLFDMDGSDVRSIRLSPLGKKVVYGGMLIGVTQALALAAAGFDDEDPPEFVRDRSLVIPVGGKKYISIPMPLGLHVFPGLGRHATEFALSGFKKPAHRAVSVIGMFADAFNPIGNAGLSMQTLAPTALDPLVALTENKDWTGKPIARTSSNKAIPGFTQWKDTATAPAKLIAEGINWMSGGNQYVAGVLSPTPDQIDYLFAQVTGGVGRELSKIEQTVKTVVQGEELPTYKIPLLGRFIGDGASQASQSGAFYANANKLNELETEVKGLRKDGRAAEAAALLRSRPEAYLIQQANVAERQIQRLRREKRELIKSGAERESVKAKEVQITAVMTRLNLAAEKLSN